MYLLDTSADVAAHGESITSDEYTRIVALRNEAQELSDMISDLKRTHAQLSA